MGVLVITKNIREWMNVYSMLGNNLKEHPKLYFP